MVKVEIDAWSMDPVEGQVLDKDKEPPIASVYSVIFLPQAAGMPDIKTGSTSVRWDKF